MYSSRCSSKRKKLRTRKCLDELRKRARYNRSDSSSSNKLKIQSNEIINDTNANIISSRLTLASYPNAIRSEVITRPALLEIRREENINLNTIVTGKIPTRSMTCGGTSDVIEDSDVENDPNANEIEETLNDAEHNVVFFGYNNARGEEYNYNINSQGINVPSSPSTRSPSPFVTANEIVENVIDEMTEYMEQIMPPDFVEEALQYESRNVAMLYRIRNDMQGYENNILRSLPPMRPRQFENVPAVDQNAIDFIRQGCIWCREDENDQNEIYASSASSLSSSQSMSMIMESPIQPDTASPTAPETMSQSAPSPDFPYYPHRLN